MFSAPLLILVFILTQKSKLKKHAFESRFGSLYEGLKTKDRMQIFCNFIFTARRVLLILSAVYLGNYQFFQVQSYIFLSQINLMYLMHYRPYLESSTNNNEIFNEACVLALSYQLFIFTDFVDDINVKLYTGYGLIAAILANFGINLILQIIQMIRTMPKAWRRLRNSKFCRQIFQNSNVINKELTIKTDTQPYFIETGSNLLETKAMSKKLKDINFNFKHHSSRSAHSPKKQGTKHIKTNTAKRIKVVNQDLGPEKIKAYVKSLKKHQKQEDVHESTLITVKAKNKQVKSLTPKGKVQPTYSANTLSNTQSGSIAALRNKKKLGFFGEEHYPQSDLGSRFRNRSTTPKYQSSLHYQTGNVEPITKEELAYRNDHIPYYL